MDNRVTYIFGHKNPDTDSICASIGLSYLKNELGLNTVPACLGSISSETKYALDYFGFKTPYHLNDVKLQIRDVNYHKNSFIDKNLSIKDAFDYMNKYSVTGIPVVESKNKYYGYVSLKEIAREIINGDYHRIDTSYGNILNILKGEKVLKFDKEIVGRVITATYGHDTFIEKVSLSSDDILIIGDRAKILEYAIDSCVKLIILIKDSSIDNHLISKARKNKVNIIRTSFSSYEVGKTISLSNYIKNLVRSESESITFNEIDYLSDFLEKSKNLKHTNYPILNKRNECMGVLTLTDTNNVNRKKVMLVDHNNFSQSVDGLEEADILEVIDHHNIGDIVTKRPINFRNSSCGCTSTIIYEMFNENHIKVPSNIAGLLASAIISDTVLLTSPTTTDRDINALEELSKIAGIDYKEYGMNLLKAGMSLKGLSNRDILNKDFKSYRVNDSLIGIGQILISDYKTIRRKFNELVSFLNEEAHNKDYKVLTLFVTDIFENKSYCLYNSSASDIIKSAFNLENAFEGVTLEGVISRKVQIYPYIMDAIDK